MDGAGEFNGGRRGWVQHRQAREFGGRTPLYVTRRPRPRCRRGSGPGTATMARRFGCGIYNMAQAWGSDARYLETAVGWQTARQGREAYEGMDRQRRSPARKGSWVPAAAGQAGTLPKNISRLTWRSWSSVLVRLRLDRALAPRAHGHGDPLWGVDAASITPGDAMIPGAEGWRWGNGRGRAAVLFGG